MDLAEIRKILDMMREHELSEFELEREGVTLRLKKQSAAHWTGPVTPVPHVPFVNNPAAGPLPAAPAAAVTQAEPVAATSSEDVDLAIVKSPIVGTFYRAAEPDAPPFVDTGHTVRKGQVLCIIEAMKLMNEIESEVDGTVEEVLVENAKPVEYGQPLFKIKP
jgi:acetyl-CoA carboxylase biotin carboxyl carrier protein